MADNNVEKSEFLTEEAKKVKTTLLEKGIRKFDNNKCDKIIRKIYSKQKIADTLSAKGATLDVALKAPLETKQDFILNLVHRSKNYPELAKKLAKGEKACEEVVEEESKELAESMIIDEDMNGAGYIAVGVLSALAAIALIVVLGLFTGWIVIGPVFFAPAVACFVKGGMLLKKEKEEGTRYSSLRESYSDYELYQILEANGYKTNEKNLKVLKEGLESGKYEIQEDMLDEGFIQKAYKEAKGNQEKFAELCLKVGISEDRINAYLDGKVAKEWFKDGRNSYKTGDPDDKDWAKRCNFAGNYNVRSGQLFKAFDILNNTKEEQDNILKHKLEDPGAHKNDTNPGERTVIPYDEYGDTKDNEGFSKKDVIKTAAKLVADDEVDEVDKYDNHPAFIGALEKEGEKLYKDGSVIYDTRNKPAKKEDSKSDKDTSEEKDTSDEKKETQEKEPVTSGSKNN